MGKVKILIKDSKENVNNSYSVFMRVRKLSIKSVFTALPMDTV